MRKLLSLLGFALVVFLALGWYLNWYSVSATSSEPGHRSFELDVNTKKIGDDVQSGVKSGSQKVHDLIDGAKSEPKK